MNSPTELNQNHEIEKSDIPVIIIAGPSGSGKSTFIDMLTHEFGKHFGNPRAVTTRPRRTDQDFSDQRIYVNDKEFDQYSESDMLIGTITANSGHKYGFFKPDVDAIYQANKTMILDMTSFRHVDIIKSHFPQVQVIAISPYPEEQLANIGSTGLDEFFTPIITARGEVSQEELQARIRGARDFLEQINQQNTDRVLINNHDNNLEEIYGRLVDSILNLLAQGFERE